MNPSLVPAIIIVFFLYIGVAWLYWKFGKLILDYVFAPAYFLAILPEYNYLKKNSELNPNRNHIAVVLANNYFPERTLVYRLNLKRLIKYFKKENWAYKIYFRIKSIKELKKIIDNPKTTIIYLIGHGNRHGIKINKKEMAYFCEFEKSPRKEFIAHLHCTHNTGKSLVDYVAKDFTKSFITNKKISNFGIDKFIKKVTKGEIHGRP